MNLIQKIKKLKKLVTLFPDSGAPWNQEPKQSTPHPPLLTQSAKCTLLVTDKGQILDFYTSSMGLCVTYILLCTLQGSVYILR